MPHTHKDKQTMEILNPKDPALCILEFLETSSCAE